MNSATDTGPTKLDDVIAKLQELRALHGNLDVYHSDCEWGLSGAYPGLSKVLEYTPGETPQNWPADRVPQEPYDEAVYVDCWDNHMTPDEHGYWLSREEYLRLMRQSHLDREDFERRYAEASFCVVF